MCNRLQIYLTQHGCTSTRRTSVCYKLEALAGHSLERWLVTLVHRNIQVAANLTGCIQYTRVFGCYDVTRVLALLYFLWKENQMFSQWLENAPNNCNSSITQWKWPQISTFPMQFMQIAMLKSKKIFVCSRWQKKQQQKNTQTHKSKSIIDNLQLVELNFVYTRHECG